MAINWHQIVRPLRWVRELLVAPGLTAAAFTTGNTETAWQWVAGGCDEANGLSLLRSVQPQPLISKATFCNHAQSKGRIGVRHERNSGVSLAGSVQPRPPILNGTIYNHTQSKSKIHGSATNLSVFDSGNSVSIY